MFDFSKLKDTAKAASEGRLKAGVAKKKGSKKNEALKKKVKDKFPKKMPKFIGGKAKPMKKADGKGGPDMPCKTCGKAGHTC